MVLKSGSIQLSMNNLFIFVTKKGAIYDRTAGKNVRLKFNHRYPLVNGSVEIIYSEGKTTLRRYSLNDNLGYEKELVEPGMYIVTPVFSQLLPKTAKEVRILYNRVKNVINGAKFKIEEKDDLEEPYMIRLLLKRERGMINATFYVDINPYTISIVDIDEIVTLIENTAELNFALIIARMAESDMSIIRINERFVKVAKQLERSTKVQAQAY